MIDLRLTGPRPEQSKPSRHRFEKPIHNVKDACSSRTSRFHAARKPYSKLGTSSLDIKPFQVVGGAYRDRTDDLKLAKLALSQLS